MKISINAPLELKGTAFHDFVIARMAKSLSRFRDRVTSLNVTLTDENGPRGGIDKLCRVTIFLTRFGQLTTSAKHENPRVAVAQAADRARCKLLKKLKRRKSLQTRRRKESLGNLTSLSRETLNA